MLKAIILRDFFSFKGEKKIKLKDGVNLLLGINGSGKVLSLTPYVYLVKELQVKD